MALIENLERTNWREFLGDVFRYVLDVLKEDRHRPLGSSGDDLRAWLTIGGVARVRRHLKDQMNRRGFPPSRQAEVMEAIEGLVRENRQALVELMANGIVPVQDRTPGRAERVSSADVRTFLDRMMKGERPFEEWMYAHGRSDEEIAEIYGVIDEWLMRHGIIEKPGPIPRRH